MLFMNHLRIDRIIFLLYKILFNIIFFFPCWSSIKQIDRLLYVQAALSHWALWAPRDQQESPISSQITKRYLFLKTFCNGIKKISGLPGKKMPLFTQNTGSTRQQVTAIKLQITIFQKIELLNYIYLFYFLNIY